MAEEAPVPSPRAKGGRPRRKAPATPSSSPYLSDLRLKGLPKAAVSWWGKFVELDNRIQACHATSLRWGEVKALFAKHARFKELYEEWMEERFVLCEDVLYGEAKRGAYTAAKAYGDKGKGPAQGNGGEAPRDHTQSHQELLDRLNQIGETSSFPTSDEEEE